MKNPETSKDHTLSMPENTSAIRKVALIGNPNCGKTTLFNILTGSSQYVGNWPGVTVDKIEGRLKNDKKIVITDLPGIYSLSPYTEDELVSRNNLIFEKPNLILNILDASNLERNLYLTVQLCELNIPMVIALNMTDVVRKNGDIINVQKLSGMLHCPIVEISALKGEGISKLTETITAAIEENTPPARLPFSPSLEKAVYDICRSFPDIIPPKSEWIAVRLLERDYAILQPEIRKKIDSKKVQTITEAIEKKQGEDIESVISAERYGIVSGILKDCYKKNRQSTTLSDKIDKIVTNQWLALPLFTVIMFLVYYISITTIGAAATGWLNETFFGKWIIPGIKSQMQAAGAEPWITGLLTDGIIGGVGTVLGFLPQLFILFFFLSFLEDCGYMARVAFIMNRFFKHFGLSGKSFIPLLISSGCGVPGILATKTIENEKCKKLTIMTATFIPCGAKLPAIALISTAAVGGSWWLAPTAYFTGIAAVAISGIILKKTKLFRGSTAPFIIELPSYHWPAFQNLIFHVWERCRSFIVKAGTVIFLACTLIWFLSSFGFTENRIEITAPENSFLAAIGTILAPVFTPLGFGNWEAAMATFTGLIAKENIVGTLGVLLNVSDASSARGFETAVMQLFDSRAGAISFLVFNLLCAPCVAAIGAIKRQMNSLRWTLLAVGYQTLFAYAVALMIYQFGKLSAGNSLTAGSFAAFGFLGIFLYGIFRPSSSPKPFYSEKKNDSNRS